MAMAAATPTHRSMAVSYTHLDVYKRQACKLAFACPACTFLPAQIQIFPQQLRQGGFLRFLQGFQPVSYTHLDVYKRQLQRFPLAFLLGFTGVGKPSGNSFPVHQGGLRTFPDFVQHKAVKGFVQMCIRDSGRIVEP